MSKNVILLKDYKPNVLEMRQSPTRAQRMTPNAIIKPLADIAWDQSSDFRDLLTSIDASTSPNKWVTADKVDAARFIVQFAKKNNRPIPDFSLPVIHAVLVSWAHENKVTRKLIKEAAKTLMIAGVKAAE